MNQARPHAAVSGSGVVEGFLPKRVRAFIVGLYLLLIFQVILVVTGGAVRLTGSGLGCPTWPDCFSGKISPKAHPAQGYHAWIEFGNRLLTGVDLLLIVLLLIATLNKTISQTYSATLPNGKKRINSIRLLIALQFIGFFAQAVLGGITVLTHLNPIPVSGHFLLSILLILFAHKLVKSVLPRNLIALPTPAYLLVSALKYVTAAVIVMGTVVTGSGPHAGDAVAHRYPFDPRMVSWFHADLVIALIALTVGLYLIGTLILGGREKSKFLKQASIFLGVSIGQAAIGYIQYFTGLPELIVGAHLLGACLVWISVCELGTMVCRNDNAIAGKSLNNI